jgi:L-amino acid N-acyltransferase YncA
VNEYTVREATAADQQAVLDIYNDAVLHTAATFDLEPRTWEGQQRWWEELR